MSFLYSLPLPMLIMIGGVVLIIAAVLISRIGGERDESPSVAVWIVVPVLVAVVGGLAWLVLRAMGFMSRIF